MKIEPSQLSYSTMSLLCKMIVEIERSVHCGDVAWALRDLAELKKKISSIRAVSSRLIEQ